jgi:hypothetical protein
MLMLYTRGAIALLLLRDRTSGTSEAEFSLLSLSEMVETEDMKKNHAFEQYTKKEGQEERSLDEIHAEDKVDEKNNADAGILAQVVNEKNNANTGVLAQDGISCFYSDGTPGVKCVGFNACVACGDYNYYYGCYTFINIDIDRIGCGGCIGSNACYGLVDTDVGEQSCVGSRSCASANNVRIGSNSCDGSLSCYKAENVLIGSNSCNKELACDSVVHDVGQDSCNGYLSCPYLAGEKFAH